MPVLHIEKGWQHVRTGKKGNIGDRQKLQEQESAMIHHGRSLRHISGTRVSESTVQQLSGYQHRMPAARGQGRDQLSEAHGESRYEHQSRSARLEKSEDPDIAAALRLLPCPVCEARTLRRINTEPSKEYEVTLRCIKCQISLDPTFAKAAHRQAIHVVQMVVVNDNADIGIAEYLNQIKYIGMSPTLSLRRCEARSAPHFV